MTSVPALPPAAVGVNVTVMVQFAPPATLLPQLSLARKSLLALIEEMASVPPPLVMSVTDCPELLLPTIWAAKCRLVGESATVGGARPTPVSGTFRGLCAELSRICRVADKFATASGANTMANAQLLPTAMLWLCLQSVDDKAKSEGFAPPSEKPLTVNVALPVFVKVTLWAALVVP